jgi:hypothetical protein
MGFVGKFEQKNPVPAKMPQARKEMIWSFWWLPWFPVQNDTWINICIMQHSVAPNKSTDIKQNVIHESPLTAVIWF